jgi:Recombinase/Homing endonuclease associated repeat/Recombinase zinc beta ribbon domain
MARHTVEIALWGLKHDVRVRTLQDPETFRDLLYAVVTGQRNNEDSLRRGLASQGGTRRAAQRGDYIGHLPDGYMLHTWIDEHEALCKRMVIDPERQAPIALIFRLALRGRSCGQIAKSVNKAGWLTKPVRRAASPRHFDLARVYAIIKNPRYAGLSVYGGEVVARNCWAAYVSEIEHQRVLEALRKRRLGSEVRRSGRETYLLSRLGRCGRCGMPLHAYTGRDRRKDGTSARTYLCSSHRSQRGIHQCDAPPIQSHEAEAMVVASLSALLAREASPRAAALGEQLSAAVAREELRAAAIARDEQRLGRAMEAEFALMQPHVALIREVAISQRQARELLEAERMRAWMEQERHGRTKESRAECRELNALLRGWFSQLSIEVRARTVTLTATRRKGSGPPQAPVELLIDRASWARSGARASSHAPRYAEWEKAEIIGALQGWADLNGRSPTQTDWRAGGIAHPCALTVRRKLGPWQQALKRAGLKPARQMPRHEPWGRAELIAALRAWARKHGRSPEATQWMRATLEHPCTHTVRNVFGNWENALYAAALPLPARAPRACRRWRREEILDALRAWTLSNGRAPTSPDWARAAPERPCTSTVYKHFVNWRAALEAASLGPSDAERRS